MWLDRFETAEVNFLSEGGLDHTVTTLYLSSKQIIRRGLFRYYKMWKLHPEFYRMIMEAWDVKDKGTHMYMVVQKLKRVKLALNKLNRREYSNIQERMEEAKMRLDEAQGVLNVDPLNLRLQLQENECREKYCVLRKAYNAFLYHKA